MKSLLNRSPNTNNWASRNAAGVVDIADGKYNPIQIASFDGLHDEAA